MRDDAWWAKLPGADARSLQQATKDYLNATWLRLARDYLRKEHFDPDPTEKGIKGLLLAGRLQLREALPVLREVAGTDRFKGWSAPALHGGQRSNVKKLVLAAIAEIE